MENPPARLTFGIYPGGAAGSNLGLAQGRPDDPEQIRIALDQLQGVCPHFIVRVYAHPSGTGQARANSFHAQLGKFQQFLGERRKLDLVLAYGGHQNDLEEWTAFVRQSVRAAGPWLAVVQIAEEPNLKMSPGDGCFPHVAEAVVAGVLAAREEAARSGLDVQVGFNTIQRFDPDCTFWQDLAAVASDDFRQALDYAGIDLFPDVFRPIAADTLPGAILHALSEFRHNDLHTAGIAETVPIHITEHGWPTGEDRSEGRQAEVLDIAARTIAAHRGEFHITHYEWFSLRDADTAQPGLFHRFGLLRDDYSPKPAFHAFCRLVQELGA